MTKVLFLMNFGCLPSRGVRANLEKKNELSSHGTSMRQGSGLEIKRCPGQNAPEFHSLHLTFIEFDNRKVGDVSSWWLRDRCVHRG